MIGVLPGRQCVLTRRAHLIALLALSLSGCSRQAAPPPSFQAPDLNAAARARAVRDGLTSSMSDVQILRALGQDPARLTARVANGPDGYSTSYTNATTRILITRSSYGIFVLRDGPVQQDWLLEKK